MLTLDVLMLIFTL
jgi:hypothetical protein